MYRTFDQWSKAGFKIKKGSKATWIDDVANFSKDQVEKVFTQRVYVQRFYAPSDGLMTAIKRSSVAFGAPMDDMQQLCEWIVDNPADAEDDPDHWMNVRPY